VEAVSHYLDSIPIDLYMAVDYSAVPTINDLLGGVTVTLDTDFSSLDPEMGLGKTVRLKGKQAEHFVRARMSVGDGTNASRQLRQRQWMSGATTLLMEKVQDNSNFLNEMMSALGNRLVTNAATGRLINEFNASYNYERQPVDEISGQYTINNRDFVEYHTEPDAVTLWVLSALYRPAEEMSGK
jgi:anionic cell wall polymer biosynthesis LytR-Cps2A-Psr (LCP) family protein